MEKLEALGDVIFVWACSHTLAMFFTNALREKRVIPVMHAHILITFTRLAQISTVVSMLALYGCTMHIDTL